MRRGYSEVHGDLGSESTMESSSILQRIPILLAAPGVLIVLAVGNPVLF